MVAGAGRWRTKSEPGYPGRAALDRKLNPPIALPSRDPYSTIAFLTPTFPRGLNYWTPNSPRHSTAQGTNVEMKSRKSRKSPAAKSAGSASADDKRTCDGTKRCDRSALSIGETCRKSSSTVAPTPRSPGARSAAEPGDQPTFYTARFALR